MLHCLSGLLAIENFQCSLLQLYLYVFSLIVDVLPNIVSCRPSPKLLTRHVFSFCQFEQSAGARVSAALFALAPLPHGGPGECRLSQP